MEPGPRAPGADPVPEEDRTRIRTELAREMFTEQHGRDPLHRAELSGFLRAGVPAGLVGGGRVRPDVLPGEVGVHPVGGRPPGDVRADRGRPRRRGHRRRWSSWSRRPGTPGSAPAGSRRWTSAAWSMARFTHRDSRAGDPDLHTHVAVSNKVQTLDGRWLALDARMLYRFNVAGVRVLQHRPGGRSHHPVGRARSPNGPRRTGNARCGKSPASTRDSTRHGPAGPPAITRSTAELQARFLADHGRVPTTVEMISLRQQANLATRQAKHEPRSLNEQRAAWHDQAVEVLGGDRELDDMIATVLTADAEPAAGGGPAAARRTSPPAPSRPCRAAPGAVAGIQRARRGAPGGPRPVHRPRAGRAGRRGDHHAGWSPGGIRADRDGHRDHRHPPHRAVPGRRGVGVPGGEGPAVHLTRGAGRRSPDRHRRRPDRRAAGPGRRMWSWRSWNGRPTAVAGC